MRTALLLFVVAGCTHHRDIKDAYELDGEQVEVSGQFGRQVKADVTTAGGGVTLVDKATGSVLPYGEIDKIEDTSHARGAAQGLAVGGGVGFLSGVVFGYLKGDDCDDSHHTDCSLSAFGSDDKALLFGAVVGVVGGLVGLALGGLQGSTTVYERP